MAMPLLPYAYQSIKETDIQAVSEALQGPSITRGKVVEDFEKAIAEYCGVQYAVAFNTGTAALSASYFAAEFGPADRVISTPNSFVATVLEPLRIQNFPHFVDIDLNTGNINLEEIPEALDFRSTRGKLIVAPIHYAGITVDMKALDRLLRKHPNSIVIEDGAQALGSSYPTGEPVGSCAWSQMTIFSFHPAKIMTTGEGGMVTTNDPELFYKLKLYRNNGIVREAPHLKNEKKPWYYEVQALSGNYNFTDFQAALGLSQLRRLDKTIDKRRRLVKLYRKLLNEVPHLKMLTEEADKRTGFHLFVVQIDFAQYKTTKQTVMEKLFQAGIGTQVHYIPIYRHPVYSQVKGDQSALFPQMEKFYEQALSLPLYTDLTDGDVHRVCEQLLTILRSS